MDSLLPTDRKEYMAFWEFYNRVELQLIAERYSTEARCLASFKAGIEYAKKIERVHKDLERLEMSLEALG
jgi:iron-sulfur cluster repair protein YtfE (RIC family)